MEISKMEEKAREEYEAGKSILDNSEDSDGNVPDDKVQQANQHFDAAEKWRDRFNAEKKRGDQQREFEEGQRKHPFGGSDDDPEAKGGEKGRQSGEDEAKERESKKKAAFEKALRFGRSELEGEEKTLVRELQSEAKALSSSDDPSGGLAVTQEMRNEFIRKLQDMVMIRQNARVIPTNAQSVTFPTFDFDPGADWMEEKEQYSFQDIKDILGKSQFTPHKLGRMFKAPLELIEDQEFDLIDMLNDEFARRFAEIMENNFLNGNGNDRPYGVLSAGLPTRTASSPSPFTEDDVLDLIYDIRAVYRQRGSFMMHRNAVRTVRKLKDNDGQYLWQPGLQAGEPDMLAGYPLMESEFFPDNTSSPSTGDPLMMFADWSYYWIVERREMSMIRLDELYAETDEVGYRFRMRSDAAPVLRDPFIILQAA